MKKLIFFILISILLISTVSGFEEIFNEYVYETDTFQVGDDLYYGALTIDQKTLILHKNTDEVFFIRNASCEETDYNKYCYDGTKIDLPAYGRWNQENFDIDPAVKVKIYSKEPAVTISRSISTSEVSYSGKAVITVSFENTGELAVSNVIFKEILPSNVDILSNPTGNVQLIGRTFKWEGVLFPGDSKSFSYTLRLHGYETATFNNASFSYKYETLEYSPGLSSFSVTVKTPFTYTESLTPTELSWGETMTYEVTATNNDASSIMNFDFALDIPEDFTITGYPIAFFKTHNFRHRETIAPGKSFSMSFKFKSDYAGEFNILANNTLSLRDEVYPQYKEYNVTITIPKLTPSLVLSRESVNEGGPYTVYAYMENTNEVEYLNVKGSVSSALFGKKHFILGNIASGKKNLLFTEQFKALPVDADKEFDIVFSGTYQTKNFQTFSFSETKKITVKPVTTGFTITQDISPRTVTAGDEVTVKVFVKNMGASQAYVEVKDDYPSFMEFKGGKTDKSLTLAPNQEEEFYIYKFQVPVDLDDGDFIIKTSLDYEGLVTQESNSTIIINRKVAEEVVEVVADEVVDEVITEEKVGFFKKIGNFFKSLFS